MFRRILVWFAGISLFSLAAFILTTVWTAPRSPLGGDFGGRMLDFQLNESIQAYEHSGRGGLAALLARYDQAFRSSHHLLDSAGRDLVSGETYPQSTLAAPPRPPFPFLLFRHPPVALVRRTADSRYAFLVVMPAQPPNPWANLPIYGWILLAVVGLVYVLAVQLARPIRALRETVLQFGHGDLAARTGSTRRDEIGDLERAFDEMAGRIQTLLAAERRLLADVSHELRSPLARLGLAIELARAAPAAASALDRCRKELDRLSSLVGELLQLTRAEGDPASLHLETRDLGALLAEIAADARIEADHRQVRIATETRPVECSVDAELLRRAVDNVLRNALRFAPSGSEVRIELREEEGEAVVRVRDLGPGVPNETLPRLFDPFFRVETDRSRLSGGAGLGLAIARRAVAAHGGRISARNAAPGLEIEMRIPR